tara:strand:+ start:1812 stop:2273 length:462 start_codon:yes stop_codon:yes gene_type:complete
MEIIMGAVINLVKKVVGGGKKKAPPTPAAPPEEEEVVSPLAPPTPGPSIFPKPGDVLTESEGGLPKFDKPGGSDPITDEQIAENKKVGAGYGDLSKPEPKPITPKKPIRQADAGAVGTGQFKKKRRTKTKTILTGAGGVMGDAPIQKKTLLGS